MKSIEEAEARMVELCDAAKAKGWVFREMSLREDRCGCVLEACASELGFTIKGRWHWGAAGVTIGVGDIVEFCGSFYETAKGYDRSYENIWAQLGQKMARRYVLGEEV